MVVQVVAGVLMFLEGFVVDQVGLASRQLARLVVFADQVVVDPTAAGMPGAAFLTKLLNWLSQAALWGSATSILLGAAVYGFSQQAGYGPGASRGRTLALAGVVGAIIAGLGPTVVNVLFDAARSA